MSDYLAAPYCSDASALARFLKGLKLQVARLPRFVVHEPWPQPNMLGPFCRRHGGRHSGRDAALLLRQ
jgi:hypothetical protein